MFLTIVKPSGQRLVLDVSRICCLGPPADMDVSFRDFVSDAIIRNANEEEILYFAPQEALQ